MPLTSTLPINLSDIQTITSSSSLYSAGVVANFTSGGVSMQEFLGYTPKLMLLENGISSYSYTTYVDSSSESAAPVYSSTYNGIYFDGRIPLNVTRFSTQSITFNVGQNVFQDYDGGSLHVVFYQPTATTLSSQEFFDFHYGAGVEAQPFYYQLPSTRYTQTSPWNNKPVGSEFTEVYTSAFLELNATSTYFTLMIRVEVGDNFADTWDVVIRDAWLEAP